jgi:fermentation-respiration switch protein FrsA (DUF1100 family)
MNRRFRPAVALTEMATVVPLGISRLMVRSLTKAKRVQIKDNPSRLDLSYEDVSFPAARDGVLLRGWYVMARDSDRCIVMAHGDGYHRADPTIGMLEIAKGLTEHGYNALMFDLRGHGESGEGRLTGGYYERRDILGAISYIKGRGVLPRHIGLLGFSMGAAASLLAAAENKELPALVTDSCWADLMDMIKSEVARHPLMPRFLTPVIPGIAKILYGVDVEEIKPLQAVNKIAPRPIFFIHGEADRRVPVENARRLYQANNNHSNVLWIVPNARHARTYKAQPEEYIDRVTAFFNRTLN